MKFMSRFATAAATTIASTALAVGALLVPATAQAVPILAEENTNSAAGASNICVVTGGDLSWGVKERFRSYISSTIAHGSWEVLDGASYETPLFGWSNASGEINADTGEGLISFTGTIHFTGHEGVLDMRLSNPSIQLIGDGTARLLLDAKSNDRDGNLKLDEQQVSFAKIEGVGGLDTASGEYSFTDASGVLTAEGAIAFGEFYSSGEDIDPVTLNVQFSACEGAAGDGANDSGDEDQGATENEITTQTPVNDAAADPEIPWLPIALGGVALVVIAVTATMLLVGRNKGGQTPGE